MTPVRARHSHSLRALVALVLLLSACSPTFDWREARFQGSAMVAMFPCRPDRHARAIELVGRRASMQMDACATGGATFAVSVVDLGDPALAAAAQQQLRTLAVANVRGDTPHAVPWRLAGTTPGTDAVRMSTRGRLPDGSAVIEHAAFFTQGLKVYQASVIGASPSPEALETFFAGLKFAP